MPRRLLLPAILTASLPGLATAQDRPTLLDFISLDVITQRIIQSGIMMLRTQLDLKYTDMSVDFLTGSITMTDVAAWPLPEWDETGSCAVKIGRITIRSGAMDQPDRIRMKAQLTGTTFSDTCLPEEPRAALTMVGLDKVEVPRMTIDIDYGVPASDATMRLFADITDVGVADLTADFAYIWMDGREDMEEPDPVMFLKSATLALENRGVWDAMKGQLPPPFTGDGAGDVIKGMLWEGIASENPDDAPLTDAQTAFVESVAATWPAFLAKPETLVLETGIDGDVFLDFEAIDDDIRVMFDTLKPRAALLPARATDIVSLDLLTNAMTDGADLGEDDKRSVGMALITGQGAPRNISKGLEILGELAEAGDGAAALVLADAMQSRDAAEAYRWALRAGQAGTAGATARLDRLERDMDFADILALQTEVAGEPTPDPDALGSVSDIRSQAAMRLSGRGLARSYASAAMWAMLASAAGDPEAADILDEIDERVRLRGSAAATAWAAQESNASSIAMVVWVGEDLPARLTGAAASPSGGEPGTDSGAATTGRKGKK